MTCGQSGISSSDCEMMGCCVDSSKSACYYPLDGKPSVQVVVHVFFFVCLFFFF